MKAELKKYMNLKKRAEQAQQEVNKAEGALEQIKKQLEEEFDCITLEAAKRKLNVLEKQEQKVEIEFKEALSKFEKDWGNG